ncbi:hypothetical protein ACFWOJ_26825 [Streptomyces sp. NPDC058439]|uniref:hypothetical protein n=1 Tax=Streptomyces sp. NPDC058439 TaxID=3346500 RepID=UPI003668BBA1
MTTRKSDAGRAAPDGRGGRPRRTAEADGRGGRPRRTAEADGRGGRATLDSHACADRKRAAPEPLVIDAVPADHERFG